jgi:DNA invertase Pin-like site-specific DNA recombinase
MNRIGYARVSTIEQHLDVQLAKLTQAGCDPIFQEKRSGTDDTRPVLAECLRYVRTREALVVTRLDRLARSLHHLCTIAKDLNQRGVHLIVLDQQIDTSTPSGELHFHMLGAIAQFENRLRHERQMEGIAHAKQRGVRFGRQHALTQPEVLALRQQRAAGVLIKDLMHQYGLSKASVYRYLAGTQPVEVQELPSMPIHRNGVVVLD